MRNSREVERLVTRLEHGGVSRREFMSRSGALGLSLGVVGLLLSSYKGVHGQGRPAGADEGNTDLGPLERELHLYNWTDYIAADTVSNFEKEFGIRVKYDTYESNEELLARLRAGATGYDVIVPSDYVIPELVASGTIMPITRKYITNENNISPIFRRLSSDPDARYAVPWQWGTTGIAYRTDRIKIPVDSWDVFHARNYAGKLTMMEDAREVIGAELRRLGHSLNSSGSAELALAKASCIAAKNNLKAYISAPVKAWLISGDVLISQLWSGDFAQAQKEQPHLNYVIPREGSPIWCDSMAIPKSAPNKRAAHEWINYILRPEVGAALSEASGYGTPNASAALGMKEPTPYSTAEDLGHLEYQVDLGSDTATWHRIWTEIKSAETN